MNAQANNVVHAIIPRILMQDGKPLAAIFFADDQPNKEGTIKAFIDGSVKDVPYTLYKETKQPSAQDKEFMISNYKKQVDLRQDELLIVRDRMPYKKNRPSVSLLAEPIVSQAVVDNAPQEQKSVLQAVVNKQQAAQQQQEKPVNKRSEAAKLRWKKESMQAALQHAKNLPADTAADAKADARLELAKKIADVLLSL